MLVQAIDAALEAAALTDGLLDPTLGHSLEASASRGMVPAAHAHGLCAEVLPEVVRLDEWGYPIVHDAVKGDCSCWRKLR